VASLFISFNQNYVCDPTAWLSEAGRNHQWTKESIALLQHILNSPTSGP
jgi:hypothetical protein